MLQYIKEKANQGWQYVKATGRRYVAPVAIAAGGAFGGGYVEPVYAQTPVTLPDTGIDMVGYIEALFTEFGVYFASIIGLVFAYYAIQAGMKLVKKMSSKAA